MKRSDRELGMGRAISRRDFLNGVGVVAASALMPACSSLKNTELRRGYARAFSRVNSSRAIVAGLERTSENRKIKLRFRQCPIIGIPLSRFE
jgi:hypothetical protein